MSRCNRTGSNGFGTITGIGLGYCTDFNDPGYFKGLGRRIENDDVYERARRLNHADSYESPIDRTPIPISSEEKILMLKQEKDYLELEIRNIGTIIIDISKRIDEIEKSVC